jgi:DNA modification methylase
MNQKDTDIQLHTGSIVLVDIKELKPRDGNRNSHPKEQLDRMIKLYKTQGFRNPITVSNQSGQIVCGTGRYLAAKKAKLKKVPVIYQDYETPELEYAHHVADNAVGLWSELDFSGINEDIGDLGPDFDLELLGLKDFTIDVADKDLGDEEETPNTPKESKVVRGEVYIIGDHRLMCGDSTSIGDVEKLMNGQKADMVFTDPPYNTGMSEKNNKGTNKLSLMFDDDYTDSEWSDFLHAMSASYWFATKDSCAVYMSLDWRRSHELVPKMKDSGFKFSNLIIWDKVAHGLGSDYKYTHEFIHLFKKGNPTLDTHQGDKEYQDIWHIQRKIGKDDEHNTKKPIELCERAINHASKNGYIILDLFGGSGSTLIACEKTNRKCFMMELEPIYCDVILNRWQKYTNRKAIREDGVLWEDIKNG